MIPVDLSVYGCDIHVECMDDKTESLLNRIYVCFKRSIKEGQITYRVARDRTSEKYLIERAGILLELANDDGEFLYKFDKDLTIETQKLRSDLYFLHAAVLQLEGRALALIAPSGHGKSTTTWGLLHH